MKPTSLAFILIGAFVLPAHARQDASGPVMRDAATHEQLTQTYRKSSQEDPMRNLRPSEGTDPTGANKPSDIVAESDVICFNGMATLVPKRAILHMPAALKDRLTFQAGVKLVGWSDFHAANRGWITTVEVSRLQAQGDQPLKEEVVEHYSKSPNLVVATHMGGPISVLPLKVPEDESTAQTSKEP